MKTLSIGNTNAEKWTEATVNEKLIEAYDLLQKEFDINYIGTLLVRLNLNKDTWAYWKKKFAENEFVFITIKTIEDFIESRLFERALNNKVNPAVAIFGLKNNYNWKDKQETEITGKDGAPLGFTVNIVKTNKNDSGS